MEKSGARVATIYGVAFAVRDRGEAETQVKHFLDKRKRFKI